MFLIAYPLRLRIDLNIAKSKVYNPAFPFSFRFFLSIRNKFPTM